MRTPIGKSVRVSTISHCPYLLQHLEKGTPGLCIAKSSALPFSTGGGEASGVSPPEPPPGVSPGAGPEAGEAADVPPPPPPPAPDAGELKLPESKEARLRREATSLIHRVAHLPKNPYCRICQETTCKSAPAKRRNPNITHAPRRFGDLVLGDHLVMHSEKHRGAMGQEAGLSLKDQGSGWRDCIPTTDKGSLESQRAMREFAGRHKVNEFDSDCSN